ncbi:MAG: divergent PAP2 family protein [Clostridiales bacterium]|nr:divergent PAP2 family protein [Clostridiales bacterium]
MNEFPLLGLQYNVPLLTALAAMILAQFFKVLIDYWRTKSWQKALLFSTGGMPSSHSALVSSLTLSIGFREGFASSMFAISAALMMVVMYDSAGVRRAAGKQAEAINFLFSKLEDQGLKLDKKLKELLGHKPIEVIAGGILGVMVAMVSEWIFIT